MGVELLFKRTAYFHHIYATLASHTTASTTGDNMTSSPNRRQAQQSRDCHELHYKTPQGCSRKCWPRESAATQTYRDRQAARQPDRQREERERETERKVRETDRQPDMQKYMHFTQFSYKQGMHACMQMNTCGCACLHACRTCICLLSYLYASCRYIGRSVCRSVGLCVGR